MVGSYINGQGLVSQLLYTVIVLLVFYSIITVVETIVDGVKKYNRLTNVILSDTHTAKEIYYQDLERKDKYPLIYPSANEENGLEFSYSCHLFISPETFSKLNTADQCGNTINARSATTLRHVFHKGNKRGWPLMAPGVFVHGDINTIRIYMNSSVTWDNYVDIPNIPVGKWFHLVITMKGKYMDVFINGNVTMRHEFRAVPKLNSSAIRIMDDITFPQDAAQRNYVRNIQIDGPMKGMISRMKYYAFALNYSQIDELYREGPSKKVVSKSFGQKPPYLHDDWWVTRY